MEHRLGIIGYGGMAFWHHKSVADVEGLSVAAAYDIDAERLEAARSEGLTAYEALDDFLADDSIDIVLVSTPNNYHKEMSIRAMRAGKHVVCEKPVAMSSEEMAKMMACAEECGVLFTVHQNRRWDTDYLSVKKCLQDGTIGTPYTIESRVHGQNGVIHGWRAYKVAGGGMLLDWGVHLIDQLLCLVPERVKSVYCIMKSVKTPEVDDYFKLLITFESGLTTTVEVGTYCLKKLPRWYICGDCGSIQLDDYGQTGEVVRAHTDHIDWEPEIVQTAAGPTRTMAPRPKETLHTTELPQVEGKWAQFYENVVAAVEGREELLVKPAEVMRCLRLIEAAFESNRTGCSVSLDL